MLLIPYIAFLIAESLELSGYLVIIISAFFLSLYGKPNMHPGRAEYLRDILQTMSYFTKNLACVLMGVSLPLHLRQLHGQGTYSRWQMSMGAFFVMASGLIGALIASLCLGSTFDSHEKRIQILQ